MKGGNRMTIITTEIQKWKRNKIVWCILALTLLLGAFAIERACSISRSSPFMDSFGDLYTLAFKNPVSYTHLNRFLPLLQECPKNELKEIADTLKATKELMLKAVSYTHLDVYKRQPAITGRASYPCRK